MKSIRILLVEDDDSLGFMLKENLSANTWNIDWCSDGNKGMTAFHNNDYDICLLDIMMPGKDGFELAQQIRRIDQKIPIVFITAKNQNHDKIKGFQVGADDYVTKPFSLEELKYRIEAILKRTYDISSSADEINKLAVSQCKLDVNNLTLSIDKEVCKLTYKEAQLLQMFFRSPNKIIERDMFLNSIWQEDGFFTARSMDVFISRIRKYLKGDKNLKIENIRGVGYKLVII